MLEFYDVNTFIGQPIRSLYKPVLTPEELKEATEPCGITRALVWHIAQRDYSPIEGNRLLSEAIRGHDNLTGCWTILPPQTGEVITKDFFSRMKQDRILALRAFPVHHKYLLNRVVFGKFLDEIASRAIPLLLSLEKDILWQDVYNLLAEVPQLTCILCDVGTWGSDRYTWPLLEAYQNVYLETGLSSQVAGGLESAVERFGAHRLIFGTDFPARYAEAAALRLEHADISEEDKRSIASGNLERLLAGVKL